MDTKKINTILTLFGLGIIIFAAAGFAEEVPVDRTANLMIEDFNINNGNPPNNVGGNFGESAPYSCPFAADSKDALGNPTGRSMRLPYVSGNVCKFYSDLGPEPINLHPLDASHYKSVHFYMRRSPINPSPFISMMLGVQLNDVAGHMRMVWLLDRVTDQWKQFSIPVLQFTKSPFNTFPYTGGLDITRLKDFDVFFSAGTENGNVFFDQLSFSDKISNLIIADFQSFGGYNNVGGFSNFWTNSACSSNQVYGSATIDYTLAHDGAGCSWYTLFGQDSPGPGEPEGLFCLVRRIAGSRASR